LLVVQRSRSGQPRQAAPKVTWRRAVTGRVMPAGQVTVPAASSGMKSSRVYPPGTAGVSGCGFITASCPAAARAARRRPVP
jgi:hypothetical protein